MSSPVTLGVKSDLLGLDVPCGTGFKRPAEAYQFKPNTRVFFTADAADLLLFKLSAVCCRYLFLWYEAV